MSKPGVEVQTRAAAATSSGYAVFFGNEEKARAMFVDHSVGAAIAMFMQGTQKERPLTYDLLANILRALGAEIARVFVGGSEVLCPARDFTLSAERLSERCKIRV